MSSTQKNILYITTNNLLIFILPTTSRLRSLMHPEAITCRDIFGLSYIVCGLPVVHSLQLIVSYHKKK